MSIRMGTCLSLLSMEHLRTSRSTTSSREQMRVLADDVLEQRQKAQQFNNANTGKRMSSDTDEFYLKFTAQRDKKISENAIKLAQIMQDTKDKHIITTHGDASTNELKKTMHKFSISLSDLEALNAKATGDTPLSNEQIEKLVQQYDVTHMTKKEGAALLVQLNSCGALSLQELYTGLSASENMDSPLDFWELHNNLNAELKQLADKLANGEKIYTTGGCFSPDELRQQAETHRKIASILEKILQ